MDEDGTKKKELTVAEKLMEARRLSTGVTFKAGVVDYSDGTVLQELDRRDDLDELGEAELESRKRGREEKKTGKYRDLLKNKANADDWAIDELKLAISHKEKTTLSSMKGDKKETLRARWAESKDLASDVEEEEEEEQEGGDGKNKDNHMDKEAAKKRQKEAEDAVIRFGNMTEAQQIRMMRR